MPTPKHARSPIPPRHLRPPSHQVLTRRALLKAGGALGAAAATVGLLERNARLPVRLPLVDAGSHHHGGGSGGGTGGTATALPDIQFAVGDFIAPAFTVDGVQVRFGPVFTNFTTVRLSRTPTRDDQRRLADALDTIEAAYQFSPSGLFTHVAYGVPYFRRLPSRLVSATIPRLVSDTSRSVLEEAVAAPTDVSPQNPGISKRRWQVPVRIERNDMLFTFRSDRPGSIEDVQAWLLQGSDRLAGARVASPLGGLFRVTSARVMFQQVGLPAKVAAQNGLPYASRINPQSPMWMGFADQQTNAAAPPALVTFQGTDQARLSTARAGDYFDNGTIQHLSHVILDLEAFYAREGEAGSDEDETYLERVQYMFRSNPPPALGNADQFAVGGGPAFLPNTFQGADDALAAARGAGTLDDAGRIGHEAALQRSSRLPDGTPLHIRIDGTGYDRMDVRDRSRQPKLQFSGFFPSADFFATMRRHGAAVDLQQQFNVDPDDNGLERFSTATRRQNFLVPPRRHRAFPLVEMT